MTPEEIGDLSLLALLHDIGKIGVNPAILNKPTSLTDSEWMEMKRHPEIGWRIVKEIPDMGMIANYILYHHERWDGKGYPAGLKANHIPLPSRILAVTDAFDAMTNNRVYRKKLSQEEALEELKKNAGTQFDPQIVDYFIKTIQS
jgi:HD-GYP domain-containing protein (c-di-GMP phosphodiesterase class II)